MKAEILRQRKMLGDLDEGNEEIRQIIADYWES